jgi:uncharacterized protein (DUF1499 family)
MMSVRRVGPALALLAVLPLLLGAVLVSAACSATPPGLVEGRLAPCPSSPNCVCSEHPDERAVIAPLAFPGDPVESFRALVAFLEREPRVELVTVRPDYAHAVFRTRLLRFRDDVELRLDPAARVIHVRSASRVGRSDFGVNRKRIESLRTRWVPPPAR